METGLWMSSNGNENFLWNATISVESDKALFWVIVLDGENVFLSVILRFFLLQNTCTHFWRSSLEELKAWTTLGTKQILLHGGKLKHSVRYYWMEKNSNWDWKIETTRGNNNLWMSTVVYFGRQFPVFALEVYDVHWAWWWLLIVQTLD